MNRIYSLDYLRGLAAFGIMIYHYLTWTTGEHGVDSFLGKFGIYGVSIFYILSGLTLYYVYYDRMNFTIVSLINFFKKRILRIFPLLWLVTIISIILTYKIPNINDLILNLTGLFGFIKWDTYFATGAWSIGNELVFYAFFPIFIFLSKSYKYLMIILSLIIFSFYIYFAFFGLNENTSLGEQWSYYVNPLNQVFLFLSGFLIGLLFKKLKLSQSFLLVCLLIGVLAFIFYPVTGNKINIVTGFNRILLSLICLLICAAVYKISFKFPKFIHNPLMMIGETSYSIYLLHPIIYKIVGISILIINSRIVNVQVPVSIKLTLSIFLTLLLSYFVYKYYERFFLKFGTQKQRTTSVHRK